MLSLLGSKLSVIVHALALHLEQHGLTDQATICLCLLDSGFELYHGVFSFLAEPATDAALTHKEMSGCGMAACTYMLS